VSVAGGRGLLPVIPPDPRWPDGGWLAGFPLRTFAELAADDGAGEEARGRVTLVLEDWHLHGLAGAAALVLSDLVASAVAATRAAAGEAGTAPVRVWVLGGRGPGRERGGGEGEVMLLAWDAVAGACAGQGRPGALAGAGQGLAAAARYSTRLDYYRPRWAHGGKVARALVDRPAPLEGWLAVFYPGEPCPAAGSLMSTRRCAAGRKAGAAGTAENFPSFSPDLPAAPPYQFRRELVQLRCGGGDSPSTGTTGRHSHDWQAVRMRLHRSRGRGRDAG
jgi:hypothetical protein